VEHTRTKLAGLGVSEPATRETVREVRTEPHLCKEERYGIVEDVPVEKERRQQYTDHHQVAREMVAEDFDTGIVRPSGPVTKERVDEKEAVLTQPVVSDLRKEEHFGVVEDRPVTKERRQQYTDHTKVEREMEVEDYATGRERLGGPITIEKGAATEAVVAEAGPRAIPVEEKRYGVMEDHALLKERRQQYTEHHNVERELVAETFDTGRERAAGPTSIEHLGTEERVVYEAPVSPCPDMSGIADKVKIHHHHHGVRPTGVLEE
jgi:hypothetical protein